MSDRCFLSSRKGRASVLVIALWYVLLTILMTYPAVLHLTTAPAGLDSDDALIYVWLQWWNRKALLDLQISPANLTHLYHPTQPYHPLLISEPLVQLLALPLSLTLGPIAAYNGEFLLSFILTGMTTYMLCYYLTRNRLASAVGGLIFAFFPNKMLHSLTHLPLVSLYLFPLYALFLLLLLDKPRPRYGIGLGVVLALCLLVQITHIAYFVIPYTLAFFLWHLVTNRSQVLASRFLKQAALALVLACVLAGPFLVPLFLSSLSGALAYLDAGGYEAYSADILNFLTPSSDHPVIGRWLRRLPFPVPGHTDDETLVHVGVTTLVLAGLGCVGKWRRNGMWMALGLAAATLACGPVLKFGGQVVQLAVAGKEWQVSLPYRLLLLLPFYEWGRTPARFVETLMLSLAVLASYGVASLRSHLGALRKRTALLAGITAAVLFEYMIVFPFPTAQVSIPEFYGELAADRESHAVLDVPVGHWDAVRTKMYYQIVHERPIVGGHIYREPAGVRPWMRFFELVATPPSEAGDIVKPLTGPERAVHLDHYGIGNIVLHKRLLDSEELRDSAVLWESLPSERAYEDEQIVAFRVPSVGGTSAPVPLIVMGKNWHSAEYSDSRPFRWMGNDATVEVWVHEEGEHQLRFEAQPFERPRRLQIVVGDEVVEEHYVEGLGGYVTSPFVLDGREWTAIRFRAPEGCERPSEVLEESEDARCLSILFREVEVLPYGTL